MVQFDTTGAHGTVVDNSDFIARAAREIEARHTQQTRDGGFDAAELVSEVVATLQQRRKTYGPPAEHFARTIGMINALLKDKLREPLTVEDWPKIMMCDKLARDQELPIKDTVIDLLGYSCCLAECRKSATIKR